MVNSKKGKSMEQSKLLAKMAKLFGENTKMILEKATEHTPGQMGSPIQGSGKIKRETDMELISGKTADHTQGCM